MEYYKSQLNFVQKQTLQDVNVTFFKRCIGEKLFYQNFLGLNMIYQRSRYLCWFIYYLYLGCENI